MMGVRGMDDVRDDDIRKMDDIRDDDGREMDDVREIWMMSEMVILEIDDIRDDDVREVDGWMDARPRIRGLHRRARSILFA
jgi:hypothetical protein